MSNCIECGRKLTKPPLFVLENAPASAQDIPEESELSKDKGIAMALCQCPHCGLVQFDCEPVPYFRDVIRAGGLSTTMTKLRRDEYKHLIEKYHLEGKRFIEVGCGGGEFLKILTEFPVEAFGMEHNEDLARKAQGDGLNVWAAFPETEDDKFRGAPYDVCLSFNFLEHQPKPNVMLRAIYNNLTDEGYGLITVPSLEYIAKRGTYYELIHDHLAYYSKKTLRQLLEQNGFEVLEEKTENRDTLMVIVKKIPGFSFDTAGEGAETEVSVSAGLTGASGTGDSSAADSALDSGSSTDSVSDQDVALAASLTEGYEKIVNEIQGLLVLLQASNMSLAIWGAGHQGFTLASTTMLGAFADYMIDSAPFKQWRFAPASHLRIVPPEYFIEHPTSAILIVAPGYTEEIADEIRERYGDEVNIFAIRSDAIEDLS